MTRVVLPGLLTLMVVVGFIGAAGWNRSGEPLMTLVVTERELPLAGDPAPAPGDDPGLHLRIAYDPRGDAADARNWLTEDRLRRLGFALDVPAGAPDAAETYRRMPPRVGWVVFEYGGPAWTELSRARALAREATARGLAPSRLVPVDAGPDVEVLRARYPSGHLVLRGVFRVNVEQDRGILYGSLTELVPAEITVPRELRPALEGLSRPETDDGSHIEPRYEAEIALGRAGVPYLREVRRIR